MIQTSIVLFEDHGFRDHLPLVYWRTVGELRLGTASLMAHWQRRVKGGPGGLWTRDWMADVAAARFSLPVNSAIQAGTLLINCRWLISEADRSALPLLLRGDQGGFPTVGRIGADIAYIACDERLATQLNSQILLDASAAENALKNVPATAASGRMIRYPWDLVAANEEQLRADLESGPFHQKGDIHPAAVLNHPERIRIDGARVEALAVLDAKDGPIHIDEGTVIRTHAVICGPAYIGRGTIVNPHAYLHGGCSIGPVCKIGGEIDACIFAGYSNKQHEGFLGHAYVGEWVNLGAGTTNSDLKNTYGTVRCSPLGGEPIDTGQRFFGAIIADHAKTAIGTRIPTGGSVAFAANCATSTLLPKFVPSFTWLTDEGLMPANPEALLATAKTVMERRKKIMTATEQSLFTRLPSISTEYEAASVLN